MKLRQFSWPFLMILLLTWTSWSTHGTAAAEETGNLTSSSENTLQQTEEQPANTSTKANGDALLKQAVGLEQEGKYEEAIQHYLKAVEISPQNALAHNNLAWLLATCSDDRLRNGRQAVVHAVQACKLTKGRNFSTIDTLSIALAEAGQFQKAIDLLTQVRSKVPEAKREKIDRRLAVFRAGKTYHQDVTGAPASPVGASASQSSDSNTKVDPELVSLLQKASALDREGRFSEAAEQYGKMADRVKKTYGPKHIAALRFRILQGEKYSQARQYDKALAIFNEALPILGDQLPRKHEAVTYCVDQLASVYQKMGQSKEALKLYSENLAVHEASLGKDHPRVLMSLLNLAATHFSIQQHEETIRLLNDCLARNQRGQGDKNPALPMVLSLLGTAQNDSRHPIEAEKSYLRALAIHKTQESANRSQKANLLRNLAKVQADLLKFDAAIQNAVRAVEIMTEIYGKKDIRTASTKGILALVYRRSGKLSEAEPLLEEVVPVLERSQSKTNSSAALFQLELARLYLKTGRADEAEKVCLRCIDAMESLPKGQPNFHGGERSLGVLAEIAGRTGHQFEAKSRLKRLIDNVENRFGKDHLLLAKVLQPAGEAYSAMGDCDEAKACFTRCLEIQRAKLGPEHPEVAMTLQRLGYLNRHLARYAEAEPYYEESIRIHRARLGAEHWLVAGGLCDLGFLYMRLGRYAEAEKNYEEAVRIAEKSPGTVAKDTLQVTLSNWGRLCNEMGYYTKAKSLHKKALAMAEEINGRQHHRVAWNCVYLGQLYWVTEQLPEAERYYRQAIEIFENTKGKEHPDTYVARQDLGGVLYDMGQYDEAESLLQRSLAFLQNKETINEHDRFCLLTTLYHLHMKRGQSKEAIRCGMEAQKTYRYIINHILPGLSPNEQVVYLSSKWQQTLAVMLSMGLNLAKEEPEAVDASAEWVLNGKSLSTELLAEQVRLAQQSKDPALAETVRELAEVRGQLAHMVYGPDEASDSSKTAQLGKQLAERELELSRRLGQKTLTARPESSWITLDEVRDKLPERSVLIEIAKFPVYRMKEGSNEGEWDRPRYVAWVIPPKGAGDVTLVDLGDSERIDQAVAKCRQEVELFPNAVNTVGLKNATKITLAETAKLSSLVWQPLKKATNGAEKLIVSPDGGLWLYPWEAMTDVHGNFLVEKKQISYLVTGRQLVLRGKRKAGTTVAIFANPDYDAKLSQSESDQTDAWTDFTRLLLKANPSQGLKPLPDGAAEADLFEAKVKRYVASKPNMYCGKKASENEFKKLKSPRVLVISTHGYFLQDHALDNIPLTQEARRVLARYNLDRFSEANKNSATVMSNPLIRCGLAMAGVNRRQYSTGANDGVLTGLEILGTDFSGTELVVLSACETGVGAVRNAEGIAGLHHAFQLAGAKTVVATSWSVLVKPSTELIQAFFDNLANKKGKVEALRNAQVSLIKNMRKTTGSVHPALWAGYTIIGGKD